ncbi:MAG: TetR/AcrR family transcriptional regulator C-terminal domain-containing protein [Pseudonocardia sp.]
MAPRRGNGGAVRRPLTRREVVAAALELVDAEGVDTLTMRKLADRIGVYPTAVYWHAGNKASLLAAVAELVLSGVELPPVQDGPPWEEWLRSMARAARAALHAHPNITPVLASQLQVTTSSFPLAESVLAVLHGAGFTGERLTGAFNTVIGFVFGWIFGELTAEPSEAAENWTSGFEHQLRAVDPQAAPTLAANLPVLANQAFMLRWESGRRRPMDASFELALDVLVAGLAAQTR